MVLKQHNTDVITMEKPVEIPKLIKEGNIDDVLLDMNFSPGIPEENLGNIFIPFFSTKKRGLRYRAEPVKADHETPPQTDRCRNRGRSRNYLYS
jgi:hypothetical protein